MSASPIHAAGKAAALELDEAFLRRADQAMLRSKQRDPYRLDRVHRALEQEVQLGPRDSSPRDHSPYRGATHPVLTKEPFP